MNRCNALPASNVIACFSITGLKKTSRYILAVPAIALFQARASAFACCGSMAKAELYVVGGILPKISGFALQS